MKNGGQFVISDPVVIQFRGALLPLSNEDLEYAAQGGYTSDNQKIYTNNFILYDGEVVTASNGVDYVIITELTHTYIHNMRRYIVQIKGQRTGSL